MGAKLFILVMLLLLSVPATASDTLLTVRELGHRVLSNLNYSDTLNGSDALDSATVQRFVRDIVNGGFVSYQKSKAVVTADGTFGYEIDSRVDSLIYAVYKKDTLVASVPVKRFEEVASVIRPVSGVYSKFPYSMCANRGDSIYLAPIARKVDTIFVYYNAFPDLVTEETDTVNVPVELYDMIESLATAKAAKKIGRTVQ